LQRAAARPPLEIATLANMPLRGEHSRPSLTPSLHRNTEALHERSGAPHQLEGDFAVDEAQFWELVQRTHDAAGDDMDRKCEVLKAEIGILSKNDANDFAILFDTMMDRAYSYKLWGAAYVIHGGCGDDTFDDFRSSLISRGRCCFERAIADPDSLADEQFDETTWFYEGYQYAVTAGVKAVAGLRPRRRLPDRPSGEDWAEDDLWELFPRLNARFT
jgi:hypothetical protein